MAELMDHVEALADQIGPRPVSTEEERQAAMYIAQELTDLGLEVNVDEFATPTGVRWPFTIAFAAVIVGTILSGLGMFIEAVSTPFFILGLLLVVVGFAIYYTERQNRGMLSSRRAGGVSQNVVARYVPSSVARERSRRKVIIAAHVDTVRAEPQAMPAVINRYPLIRKILFYVMIALPVVLIVRLLPIPWPDTVDFVLWVISLIACVLVLVALGCIVAGRFMPYVSGGNDNASAAAVMLSVAKRLLDPEERERYAREQREVETEVPVETFAPQGTGSFAPVADDGQDVVVHDEDAALEAGVVPEGAEIEYANEEPAQVISLFGEAPDTASEGQTVAMPAVWDESADASGPDSADAFEDAVPQEGAEVVAFPTLDASEQPVVDMDARPDAEANAVVDVPAPEGAEAPDAAQAEAGVAQADAGVAQADEAVETDGGEQAEDGQDAQSAQDASDGDQPEDDAARAPEQRPNAFDELMRKATGQDEPQESETPNVPSWYTAARQKAAEDRAVREEAAAAEQQQADQIKAQEQEQSERAVYRSRFADVPLAVSAPEPEQEAEELQAAEPVEEQPAPRRRLVDLHTGEELTPAGTSAEQAEPENDEPAGDEPAQPEPAVQPDAPADAAATGHEDATISTAGEPVADAAQPVIEQQAETQQQSEPEAAAKPEPVSLGISDDDLDEISPDLTGSIPAVEKRSSASLDALTTRIPSIGTSDRDSAERADDASKPREAKPRVERRKPTARRATEEFQPTRITDEREQIERGSKRQAAAVSSSYEDTPQAAPKSRQDTPEANVPRSHQPGLSGTFPTQSRTADAPARPSSTSSFPALTGSFPSLTGSIPRVNADDFGTPTGGDFLSTPTVDDAFASPASLTGQIDIPESRFHNAVDSATGFFERIGRKGKNTRRDAFEPKDADEWGESDDFGWKGGAYFSDDEGLGDAARRRAAEIRESVISMTESDLLDKEVWFVALGASNAGGQGMKNFLDLHRSELRGSLIINLESVGSGEICYVDYEGTGKLNRADRRLMSLIKRASRELKGKEMPAASLDYRNTDATYATMAGMRAISIMGFDGVAPEGWHWTTDTSDIVNPEKLDFVSRLLMKVIENS